MTVDVAKELRDLKQMSLAELRAKYAEVYGEESRSRNKPHLVKRIIWGLQAREEGGLSERARRRARELADETLLRVRPPRDLVVGIEPPDAGRTESRFFEASGDRRLPPPGSFIKREYKGETVTVAVLQDGFEFRGERYRSLSAVAKAVSGSHWNGFAFFGLAQRSGSSAQG